MMRCMFLVLFALGLAACGQDAADDGDADRERGRIEEMGDDASDTLDAARDAAGDLTRRAGESAERAGEAIQDAAGKARDRARDAMEKSDEALDDVENGADGALD